MSHKIENIHAHEILDSRGNPTINVSVILKDGTIGTASVPSGASTGVHEALELRDGDAKRYNGKGVLKAVHNVNTQILKAVREIDVTQQREIDAIMIDLDGTQNKKRFGANAILGVSLACAHAGSKAMKLPLYAYLRQVFDLPQKKYSMPIPTMNVLNGGVHAEMVLDFQEFMIVPHQKKFKERCRCGSEIFQALGSILKQKHFSTLKGDEGGYAAKLGKNEDGLKMIMLAIKKAGYKAGEDVFLAIDPATSEFYNKSSSKYELKSDNKSLSSGQMIAVWEQLIKKYPIISIEDGLEQDDWKGWVEMTKRIGNKVALVGDDFFVTNVARLQKGIEMGAANAILIKVNQIGSLSESIDAILLAQQNKYKVSISHRSGETSDTTIADIAVAVNADFIKSGSLSRSERLAKYNRLMEIEEELEKSK